MKNSLRLVALALVAAALAGIYYYLSMDTEPGITGLMYTFPAGDHLVEMNLTNSHGKISLARQNNKWAIVQPGSYRANLQKVNVMESLLLEMPVNRQLDSELPEYGFSNPQATVEFVSSSGLRKELIVGNPTTSKAQVYLKDKQSGKILITDIGSVTQFDGSLDAYREKDIFSVDKTKIVQFTYYQDGVKQVSVEQDSSHNWQLTYPYRVPARKIEINEYLIKLRKWTAVMYPAGTTPDYKLMGLDKPSSAMDVVDANGQSQHLEFGSVAEGVLFVRTGSQEDVAGIFAVDVDFSPLTAPNLLFFEPLHATIDQVKSIEIRSADKTSILDLDQSTQPPRITSDGKLIPYEPFVSFFVKYITLNAVGYEDVSTPGQESLALKTTFVDGSTVEARLLKRDASSHYLQVGDQKGFYLPDDKVALLFERLDAALAAEQ